MNWEDYPPLSTAPYGVQTNGAVVELYPPALSWTPPVDNTAQLVSVSGGPVTLADLPTADPLVAGQLWNDGGVPTVSAG